MKEIWILTYDNGCESRAFRSKEKAREAVQETLSNIENLSNLRYNEVDEEFEYWSYNTGFETIEVCLEKVEIED